MRLWSLVLALVLSSSAHALPRVFLAPLRATDVKPGITDLLGDQLLVSARRHQALYEVVGAADVKGLLDVEAARAALGCETDSCANEVADALDADQLLTGQLGRVGDVWLLTLTRTDRKTLQVLARASVEARGDSPEVLLPRIPKVVDEALSIVHAPNLWAWSGGILAAVGAVPLLAGGTLYAFSFERFGAAQQALAQAPPEVETAKDAESWSKGLYWSGLITGISGATLVVLGGATAVFALATEE